MDASELLKCYGAGARDFSGVDLINAKFIGVNLSGADLSGADLSGADLTGANLSGADLSGADLSGANLLGADLLGADLRGVYLIFAQLLKANLSDTNLRGAELFGADLSFAQLSRTNLSFADLNQANLSGSNLMKANLIEANLISANLTEASLKGANLSFAYLIDANLTTAILIGADLNNAYLNNANLSGANLTFAILNDASLNGANLEMSNLASVSLSGADLRNANLSEANLAGIDLTNAEISGAIFNGTILVYQNIFEELQRDNQELTKRIELLETHIEKLVEHEVQKRLVTNQGITAKKSLTWNRLRFRSEAERKIAEVLDEMGVMYFPNASGRVMSEDGMETREVDFLICSRGKWGILECDGELWHFLKKGKLPSAANDHKRDNNFNRHGQWFIKRFTAEECKKNPHKVIRQFLDMLHKFHEDQRYLIIGDSAETESSLPPINLSLQSEGSSFQSHVTLPELTTNIIDDEAVNVFSEGTLVLDNAEIQKRLEAIEYDEDGDILF